MSRCRHELCRIPGIGEKMAQRLRELGYQRIAELKGADPQQMYQRLIMLRGAPVDRCVLYTFRCAVYFASNPVHEPQKLHWWYWKDDS
ncbi:MAG: helix-hairpin-helix domain-containing protein [Gammaproteobacteria bacterium]|nr:helix-hairpin-helix domain-containing protein [Gammaproteobacteria bacterium]